MLNDGWLPGKGKITGICPTFSRTDEIREKWGRGTTDERGLTRIGFFEN